MIILQTFWEKDKMLVTSIFSFSQNAFYLFKNESQFLCHSELILSSANAVYGVFGKKLFVW